MTSENDPRDTVLCARTSNSMKDFLKRFPNHRWYFRAIGDTFINLTNLIDLIDDLETKYDPMNEVVMAYNIMDFEDYVYPHGGPGYLFSNYAVNLFVKNIDKYTEFCYKSADDLAFNKFFKYLNISIGDNATIEVPYFPNEINQIPKDKKYLEICPEYYVKIEGAPKIKVTPVKSGASYHMHAFNMSTVTLFLQNFPEDIGITYKINSVPKYCYFSKN